MELKENNTCSRKISIFINKLELMYIYYVHQQYDGGCLRRLQFAFDWMNFNNLYVRNHHNISRCEKVIFFLIGKPPNKIIILFDIFDDKRLKMRFLLLRLNIVPFPSPPPPPPLNLSQTWCTSCDKCHTAGNMFIIACDVTFENFLWLAVNNDVCKGIYITYSSQAPYKLLHKSRSNKWLEKRFSKGLLQIRIS